jgi:hypothetical protein
MKFWGRKKTPRKVTIKPDGSVDLTGYPLGEMIRLSQHPAFRQVMREAREHPPADAEVRDVEFR